MTQIHFLKSKKHSSHNCLEQYLHSTDDKTASIAAWPQLKELFLQINVALPASAAVKKKKNLFPVGKYNIDTQNAYKHQIFITAYRRLPESFYKLSMLATYNT